MKKSYLFFGVLIAILLCGFFYLEFSADLDTIYPPRISEVKIGMTKDEVKSILGEPYDHLGIDCWNYAKHGRLKVIKAWGWIDQNVCFKDNKVSEIVKNKF